MENQNLSMTHLFRKQLNFRDHQLKKIQIKSLKFAISLGFSQNVFVNISNPSKIKSELSDLMGWGIAITTLLLLLLHYVKVISLGEKRKQTKRGIYIGTNHSTHGYENRAFLLCTLWTTHYTTCTLAKVVKSKLGNIQT